MLTALILTFVLCLLAGMPIAFCIGLSSLTGIIVAGDIPLILLPQKMFTGVDFYALVAIPFFILAGELMNAGKITATIINFTQLLVGRLSGGLAHVNILASMFFAGITGAAVADTSAMGSIMIPAMEKEGYDKPFAAAVTAASSVMGPIIPPSIIMVIYAMVEGSVSIGALFLAGIIPGILIGLSQMFISWFIAVKRGYPKSDEPFSFLELLKASKKAVLPLLTPIIIMGGILGGIFTPTEAAAVAVFYAFIIGHFVFKTLPLKAIPPLLFKTCLTTGMVFLIFCTGKVLVVLLTISDVPQLLTDIILSITNNPLYFLLLVNIMLLIVGCFMEVGVAIIILVPVLAPVAAAMGIESLHFAIIVVVNLCIGLITPPLGVVLFVVCGVGNVTMESISKAILPYLITMIMILLVITFYPAITLLIPKYFGYL